MSCKSYQFPGKLGVRILLMMCEKLSKLNSGNLLCAKLSRHLRLSFLHFVSILNCIERNLCYTKKERHYLFYSCGTLFMQLRAILMQLCAMFIQLHATFMHRTRFLFYRMGTSLPRNQNFLSKAMHS